MSSASEHFEKIRGPHVGGDTGDHRNAQGREEPVATDLAELIEEVQAFLRAPHSRLEDGSPERFMETRSGSNEIGIVTIEELTAAAEQIADVLPMLFRYARNSPEDVQSFLKGLVNSFYIRSIKPEL